MKNFLLLLGFLCTSTLFAQFTYNDGGLGGIQSPNTSATGVDSFSAGYQTLASGDYGATALGSFRYGNVVLSEAITLSGQRIIQESALCANRHMNKVIKGNI